MNLWESLFRPTPTHDEQAVEAGELAAEARATEHASDQPWAEPGGRRARRAGLVRTKGGEPQLDVGMSRRQRRRAFRESTAAEAKRAAVLLPSAREVFAIRPRVQLPDGTRRTVAWPTVDERDASYLHDRLRAAGLR